MECRPDSPKTSPVGGTTAIELIERRICTTHGSRALARRNAGKADQKRGKSASRNRLVIMAEALGAPRIQLLRVRRVYLGAAGGVPLTA